jgi:hypothetical protein
MRRGVGRNPSDGKRKEEIRRELQIPQMTRFIKQYRKKRVDAIGSGILQYKAGRK